MGITRRDIIDLINTYRQGRNTKALPVGTDIADFDKQSEYLLDLVRQNQSNEIQVTNAKDAKDINRAVSMLSSFSNMSSVKDTKGKISEGKETAEIYYKKESGGRAPVLPGRDTTYREVSAFDTGKERIAYYRTIRTLGDLRKIRNDWLKKKDYIYFPQPGRNNIPLDYYKKNVDLNIVFSDYARKVEDSNFGYYRELASKLPREQANKLLSLLNAYTEANRLFALDKTKLTQNLDNVVRKFSFDSRKQGQLSDNTLIMLKDLSDADEKAILQIESMMDLPVQTSQLQDLDDFNLQSKAIANLLQSAQKAISEGERQIKENETWVKSAKNKLKDGTAYNDLTKEERIALQQAGAKEGMSGVEYYNNVLGKQINDEINKIKSEEALDKEGMLPTADDTSPDGTNTKEYLSNLQANFAQGEKTEEEIIAESMSGMKPGSTDDVTLHASESSNLTEQQKLDAAKRRVQEKRAQATGTAAVTPPEARVRVDEASISAGPLEFQVAPEEPENPSITQTQMPQPSVSVAPGVSTPPEAVTVQETTIVDATQGTNLSSNETISYPFSIPEPETPTTPVGEPIGIPSSPTASPGVEIPQAAEAAQTVQLGQGTGVAAATTGSVRESLDSAGVQGLINKYSNFTARVVSRRDAEMEAYLSRAARNRTRWNNLILGKTDIFSYIAERENLLGDSYPVMLAKWLQEKGKLLGNKVKVEVGSFIYRKFNDWSVISTTKAWFQKTNRGLKAVYLNWERKHKNIHQIVNRFRFIPDVIKTNKKKKSTAIAESIAKAVVHMASEAVKAVVRTVTNVSNAVSTAVRLPKNLINSPTSIWEKIQGADSSQIADKLVGNVSEAINSVRTGFQKLGVMMGEVASIYQSITKPIGILLESLPLAGITGLAATFAGGPVLGISIGVATLAGNSVEKFLSMDPTRILAINSKFQSSEFGFLGNALHKVADVFRLPYKSLMRNGFSAGLLKAQGLEGKLTPEMIKTVETQGGIFTKGHMALRAFNNASLLGSIGAAIGTIFGPQYAALGAGIGVVVGGGGTLIKDALTNRAWVDSVRKTGTGFMALPITETLTSFANISMLGQELSLIQTKYHWNFGEYFRKEFTNPMAIFGRGSNWALGMQGLMRLPQVMSAWFKSTVFTRFIPATSSVMADIVAPATVGWVLGLGALALMGVPLTPVVIGGSLLGMAAGATAGVITISLISGLTLSGPIGWVIIGAGSLIGSFLGGGLGYWIDQRLNGALNKAMSMFGVFLNGIQALFELIKFFKNGLDNLWQNIIPFIMALSSIIATFSYMSDLSATNNCTTDDECNKNKSTSYLQSGFLANGETDYLYYYDLNVLSAEKEYHKQNIQKVLTLLGQNPDLLNEKYGDRKKYIYIGNSNEVYTNDTAVIIAISRKQLYSGSSINALIDQSTASLNAN